MQRFYGLRDADKLRAYKSIREHLGDRVGQETRHDEIVARRTYGCATKNGGPGQRVAGRPRLVCA